MADAFPVLLLLGSLVGFSLLDKHPVLKRDLPKNFGPQSPSAPVLDSLGTVSHGKMPEARPVVSIA